MDAVSGGFAGCADERGAGQGDETDDEGGVSVRLLRCRNPLCPTEHGDVLGRVTANGGLVLATTASHFQVHVDTGRTTIRCPACGTDRDFRGRSVYSAPSDADRC